MVVHACTPKTLETEGRENGAQGYPWLHRKFHVSLAYMKPSLIKILKKKKRDEQANQLTIKPPQPHKEP